MPVSPTAVFGNVQLARKPEEVFRLNSAGGVNANQLIARGLKREIDRLQGFKVDITPADARRLADLQTRIARLEANAGPDGLSTDAFNDRAALFREAYDILGKPYVDIDKDPTLKQLVGLVDTLLEPKLNPASRQRLENLRKLEENYFNQFSRGNTSKTLAARIANVQQQIKVLTPPRKIKELNFEERAAYDKIVEQINLRAGQEYLMPAAKREKAERLAETMATLGG
ncbi:MAG: hypothetical protein VX871_06430 [Pseudomonadota bacterium]|nr:hypothetical protein [Pseudomonadota bacterium]